MFEKINRIFQRSPRRAFQLIQVEPSLECSLECVMCPWSEIRPQNASMSWDTFERIVPYFQQAISVDFTGGGEPFKHPRLVDMVRAAKEAGCEVGFSTNGTRLAPEVSEQLIAVGLDWISFSIDAATPELYERIRQGAHFEKVMGHIAALRDLKQRHDSKKPRTMAVYVMMTGEQENFHELPAFIELAHSLGIEQVVAKNLDVILKDGDDERRLFTHAGEPAQTVVRVRAEAQQRAGELGLGLRFYDLRPQEVTICEHNPLRNVFINWEGQVSPCITLSYAETRVFDGQRVLAPCQRFGDIRTEGLKEIWDKLAYEEFRSHYEARLRVEQGATLDALLGGSPEKLQPLPAAPESCRTCYYLYGI